jgi:membrane-bound lytic murein transglycosylase MltF
MKAGTKIRGEHMRVREFMFFIVLVCLILGTGVVLSKLAEEPFDTSQAQHEESEYFDRHAGNNGSEPQNRKEQQDAREELRQKLRLSSDILEEQTHDLSGMKKAKRIRVLTTYTFANYFVHKGKAHGYEYGKMEEFKKFLNKDIKGHSNQVDFFYIPIPYDLLIEGLNKGYGDIVAANMTITTGRTQEVDFTEPYIGGLKEVLISHKKVKGIESEDDLSGLRIYIREGSSYQPSLEKLNQRLRSRNVAPAEIVLLPGLVNTGELIEMVNAGIIEMTVADNHIASIADELLPEVVVHDNIVFNDDVRFGWMVRKRNPELKAALNQFVKTVKKGTLLGNIYFKRYFKENPWVREAIKTKDLNKFSKYSPLFRKYSEKYGLDWILIAALSYQESRFDPNVRSRQGAVGLMQVLPSTGEYLEIPEVKSPENNVHAGVKYMRYLIDKYFSEEGLTDDNRMRLALAAYNAGPTNIKRSRQTTEQMGYDPNKWFGHTELAVLRRVGPEPVQYVRNINKYYISFLISDVITGIKEELIQQKLDELKK